MEPKQPITQTTAEDYAAFIKRLEAGELPDPSPEAIEAAKKDYLEFC